jgi:hypothetical protein
MLKLTLIVPAPAGTDSNMRIIVAPIGIVPFVNAFREMSIVVFSTNCTKDSRIPPQIKERNDLLQAALIAER